MQAFGLCPTGIMQLSSQIPNEGESHLNLSQFTFFVQMYLCWMFKTIFMLIQILSKWLKDAQLVHCQQHWTSFFAKIRGTIGQMHDHIFWKAPCSGGKMEKEKKSWPFSSLASIVWHSRRSDGAQCHLCEDKLQLSRSIHWFQCAQSGLNTHCVSTKPQNTQWDSFPSPLASPHSVS